MKTSGTVLYHQNKNWLETGIILDNNNISQSYLTITLLNDTDIVTQRNRSYLIKMNSNLIKIDNDNDMEMIQKPNQKQGIAGQQVKVDKWTNLQESATELRKVWSYTT